MKDKYQHIFLLTVVLLFAGIMTYGMIRYKGENMGLYERDIHELNQQWYLLDQSGYEIQLTLPAELDIPDHTEYSICMTVPEEITEGMFMLFRTTQQSIRVAVDDQVIYERGCNPALFPGEFRGSSWNAFLIRQDYVGKKLMITLMSPYKQFSGNVSDVFYGYKSALLFYIIEKQMGQLICATIMMIIGILLFCFLAIKAKCGMSSVHITYLALFAIFCSFYLFGESRMLQFYVSNEFLVTSLSFISEILFPIPLFMYIRCKWMPQHKWIALMFQWVFAADFVVIAALQMSGIADFFETIIIFHVSVFAAMLAIIIISCIEIFKYHYKESYVLAQALGVLILGSAAGIFQIYYEASSNVGSSLQIGIIGFELVMAIDSIQNFSKYEEELREKAYYEKLAYIDALTDGQNRNAYMNRIFQLSKNRARTGKLYYALFDMNNLKIINDTYGHAVGDDAIKRTYRCLVKAFGRIGDCYRIGGDEFAVIIDNDNTDTFDTANKALEHEIELNNREVDYVLSIAGGYAVCGPEEEISFEALMRQADQMLYRNKHRMKLKNSLS